MSWYFRKNFSRHTAKTQKRCQNQHAKNTSTEKHGKTHWAENQHWWWCTDSSWWWCEMKKNNFCWLFVSDALLYFLSFVYKLTTGRGITKSKSEKTFWKSIFFQNYFFFTLLWRQKTLLYYSCMMRGLSPHSIHTCWNHSFESPPLFVCTLYMFIVFVFEHCIYTWTL